MYHRSPETERIHRDFHAAQVAAAERLAAFTRNLEEHAPLAKAAGLGRVPLVTARVLREMHRGRLLGTNVTVAGTNVLYAYEAAAGILISPDLMATGDLDLLMDARTRLRLRYDGDPGPLLRVLQRADRSFALAPSPHRAVNRDGFFVDLIKVEPKSPWRPEKDSFGPDDLVAAPIANMRWIQAAPKFAAVAIGHDGFPMPFVCADPRAFALYKLWMGTCDPERDPRKRQRDIAQAETVAAIVHSHLTHLPFLPEHLACFPRAVREAARQHGDGFFRDVQA